MKSACGSLEYFFKSSVPLTFFFAIVESGSRCTLQESPEPA